MALRESEKRHELAMNASKDGFWDRTPAGGRKLYLQPPLLKVPASNRPRGSGWDRAAMFERLFMPQEDRSGAEPRGGRALRQ